MNSQERMNLLRQILTWGGALLTGRGVASAADVSAAVSNIMTIIPALVSLGSIAWSVYAHWNMKKVPQAAKVVASLVMFGVVALAGVPAFAADLATKAPSLNFQPYPTNGCGAYYGINALGSASPIANATPGATAIGGDVGGTLGYTCASSASTFWFAEFMADFQNLNGSGPGFSLTGPAHLEERAAFGGPINQLLNVLPNLNLPAVPSLPGLPSGITAGPTNGYVYAAINEDDVSATFGGATGHDWIISPEVGVGMLSRLSNNVVADVWAGARLQSQEVCVGGFACPKLSTGLVTGLAFKY